MRKVAKLCVFGDNLFLFGYSMSGAIFTVNAPRFDLPIFCDLA
jgi:hypothetical protein